MDATEVAENAFDDGVTIHIMQGDENLFFSRFTLENGSPAYQVKARKKDITEAIIPAVYNGLPVARIADNGFVWCEKLVSVTIPDSITEIGNNAFAVCQSLKSIIIPKSVTKIGNYIFVSCTSLEALSVEEGNPYTTATETALSKRRQKPWCMAVKPPSFPTTVSVTKIGDKAFINCTTLVSVTIPAPVTEIGDNAFAKCENLAEVTLSEGLKTIGRNAFGGCTTLKEIEIPASAEEIAENAFGSNTNVIFKEKEEAA